MAFGKISNSYSATTRESYQIISTHTLASYHVSRNHLV